MSYCRFSDDNWTSDVYCYEADGGFVTHVARSRVVGFVPPLPPMDDIPAWLAAYLAQQLYLKAVQYRLINLPHAGRTFIDVDPPACISRLLMLRELGYHVPEHAVEELRHECEEVVRESGL